MSKLIEVNIKRKHMKEEENKPYEQKSMCYKDSYFKGFMCDDCDCKDYAYE